MLRPTGRPAHRSLRRWTPCLSALVVAIVVATAAPAAAPAATPPDSANQVVSAFGYSVQVPADWPVVDLTAAPQTCVRFDRNAVYLGHPGTDQSCPPQIVGSTDALLIEPLDGSAAAATGSVQADAGQPIPRGPAEDASNQIDLVVPNAQVRVTATFGASSNAVRGVLSGAVLTASGSTPTSDPVTPPAESALAGQTAGPAAAAPAATTPTYLAKAPLGRGFDACGLPSTSLLSAWKGTSGYSVVAAYLGGRNWGCRTWSSVPTPSWLSTVSGQGWQVLPIWVGYQAHDDGTRCYHCAQMSASTASAWNEGWSEAVFATTVAKDKGFAPGSYLAYDMEGWDTSNATANAAELAFLSGWSATIHAKGYKTTIYTSSCSGGNKISAALGKSGPYGGNTTTGESGGSTAQFSAPDSMWFASWVSFTPTVVRGVSCISDSTWSGKPVGWQYRGAVDEKHGGQTLNVDANLFSASVDQTDYVKGVYRVLLRRPADSGGITHWTDFLARGGSRSTFVNSIVTSTEFTRLTVTQDYLQLLHRASDSSGLSYWANVLATGRRNDLILAHLAGSAEYFQGVSGGDTETFVSNLYLDLLGRGIDSAGLAYWTGLVDSGAVSRYRLALTIADSAESARRLVTAQYLSILGRGPDAGGLSYWSSKYQQTHDILTLTINLASSAEGFHYLDGQAG